MEFQIRANAFSRTVCSNYQERIPYGVRKTRAACTEPLCERSAVNYLSMRQIEASQPALESMHAWIRRQYIRAVHTLFSLYVYCEFSEGLLPREGETISKRKFPGF
jgi:hypothetical protein